MTKDLVIKQREAFSGLPIKITCNNMIIVYANCNSDSIVLWDDEHEWMTAIRSNTDEYSHGGQDQHPFEVLFTEYMHIQQIELYCGNQEVEKTEEEFESVT